MQSTAIVRVNDPCLGSQPNVAVVVLNWNGWLDTVECIESLLRLRYRNYRIIVCDNASQDGSFGRLIEWADGLLDVRVTHSEDGRTWQYRPAPKPIPYIAYDSCAAAHAGPLVDTRKLTFIQTGTNLGYGGGNNAGMRYAIDRLHADYVWILNNDTVVDAGALERMVCFAERSSTTAIVGAKLLQYVHPARIQALGGGSFVPALARDTQIGRGESDHRNARTPIDLDHVIGASMLVRASAVRAVGMMDESYFLYREETDWCIRMRRNGWRLSYCPDSIVWHKEGRSTRFESTIHDYYSVRNMLYLVRKMYPRHVALAFVASLIRSAVPKLLRMQFGRLAVVFRAHADFVRGIHGKSINPEALLLRTLRRS